MKVNQGAVNNVAIYTFKSQNRHFNHPEHTTSVFGLVTEIHHNRQ